MTAFPVLVIGGPTASGKSGLAAAMASRFGGVVINADSMQVYQGLPLLTAQPSAADTSAAAHRLYAVLPPEDACTAARWREMALAEIEQARAARKLPVIVGGTGFYIKALLQGLSPIPDVPHTLREKISALQKEMGNPAFHKALAAKDPAMAAKLHPFNTQRLIRAWEVLEATGKSLAEWQDLLLVGPPSHLQFVTVVLSPPRDALYKACNARFEQMLAAGALAEAEAFRSRKPAASSLDKALGYPELVAYLEHRLTLPEAVLQAQQSTRHYAKRQVTWFRHQIKADLTLESPDPQTLLQWLQAQKSLDLSPFKP